MPFHRYRSIHDRVPSPVPEVERTWPSRRAGEAPLWVPVDLRDGNQALAEPMDTARKRRMFDLFVTMGFKEIEVGYPSASQTDFGFVRHLAEAGVPDDVTPVVFTPARRELIERTFASVEGLPRAVVHLYTATGAVWRDVVLGSDRNGVKQLILDGAADVARLSRPGVRFEFSPETFNFTEPDYALEVCDAVTGLWDASPDRPVILNLPATVEIATPNVYADQIEYMHRHLARRDAVILSVHPHNDRGTGVACAELAVLAGAQRVEGCLFGNGERTGNVDLVTLALNLHAQGVDPRIDFSDIDEIRRTVEYCNRLPVHERHPYGGDLVYTAFSGTHQDAIGKGMARHARRAEETGTSPEELPWDVPYLPIDPADVGRGYEAVIRVNSQSGKGGISYLLRTGYRLDLPRRLQIEFSRVVQRATDGSGEEITAAELWDLFRGEYLDPAGPVSVVGWRTAGTGPARHGFTGVVRVDGDEREHTGSGGGPVEALADALSSAGIKVDVLQYAEHATGSGPGHAGETDSRRLHGAMAVAYAECRVDGVTSWGAGRDASALTASVDAVLSAVNRAKR
ncbi:2-isopropylmalate synthase [Actinomadura latina]|uniref:2-isopropylmalate synthase n=2 Tax=Actinomadura latina TaxID=163603 RepID=A0A846YZU7_9ACTN|nr:2-isopropylmalate synthase [Actinomadura latina]